MMRIYTIVVAVVLLPLANANAQIAQRQSPNAAGQVMKDHYHDQLSLFRHTTFQQAWMAVQEGRRPMFLYVRSDNCRYCKKMLRETLSHPQISAGIAAYAEPFAFNASHAPELARKLGVQGFPTTLIISPDQELLCKIEGFLDAQEFAERVWPVLGKAETERRVALNSQMALKQVSSATVNNSLTAKGVR